MTALDNADPAAIQAWHGALSSLWQIGPAHPEVQRQVAECIDAACARWNHAPAATNLLRRLAISSAQKDCHLSQVSTDHLNGLSQLLRQQLLDPALQTQRYEALESALKLRNLLPTQVLQMLDADITSAVRSACLDPSILERDRELAEVCWNAIKAVEGTSALGAQLALELLAAIRRIDPPLSNPAHPSGNLLAHVAAAAAGMTPEQRQQCYAQLQRLSDDVSAARDQRQDVPAGSSRAGDAISTRFTLASAALLDGTAQPERAGPSAVARLLEAASAASIPLRLSCYEAAIRLADNADASVGLHFHRFVRDHVPHDNFEVATIAVMSFYLDPGRESFFRAEVHEPASHTVDIAYPQWLVQAREMIPELAGAAVPHRAHTRLVVEQVLTESLGGLAPPLGALVRANLGVRVPFSEWAALRDRLAEDLEPPE